MILAPSRAAPFLCLCGAAFGLSSTGPLARRRGHRHGRGGVRRNEGRRAVALSAGGSAVDDRDDSATDRPSLQSNAELAVLELAQSHFVSQALLAVMRLGALDVLACDGANPGGRTVDEIVATLVARRDEAADATSVNRDALFRCLRLLAASGVVEETTRETTDGGRGESAFALTDVGRLLRSDGSDSMGSFVRHWSDPPLWDAWSKLPGYVAGDYVDVAPFDEANGMSVSEYYITHPDSCSHRNAVARYASSNEIGAVLDAMRRSARLNESVLEGKAIVDVGGGYGDLMRAVKGAMPAVGTCHCLDLPDVIDDALSLLNDDDDEGERERTVTFVPGDMFDPSTLPPCDVVVTKHVLCDFSDADVMKALRSFRRVLSADGRVVVMDAVLPNGDDLNGRWNAAVSFDVLLMLSGRRGERSRLEWSNLAREAGFVLEEVLPTSSVTVDLAVLSRA